MIPLATLIRGSAFTQNRYTVEKEGICGVLSTGPWLWRCPAVKLTRPWGKICAAPARQAPVEYFLRCLFLCRNGMLLGGNCASGYAYSVWNRRCCDEKNATVAGAEGGCQAECGVAAAMAAAAAVHMCGGTNEMCANACSFALMNVMGLVCDPVAGLVQLPCAMRNASQTVNALTSADMALSGAPSLIPVDEVIEAMYKVGQGAAASLKRNRGGRPRRHHGRETYSGRNFWQRRQRLKRSAGRCGI